MGKLKEALALPEGWQAQPTGQSNDAAERSAHVLRDATPAIPGEGLPLVVERKNERGQTTGQLRVVVDLTDMLRELLTLHEAHHNHMTHAKARALLAKLTA